MQIQIRRLFMILVMITLMPGCGKRENNKKDSAAEPNTANASSASKDRGINIDNFNRINIGMTRDQVSNILGSKGSIISGTKNPDNGQFLWATMEVLPSKVVIDFGVVVEFSNGKVTKKMSSKDKNQAVLDSWLQKAIDMKRAVK